MISVLEIRNFKCFRNLRVALSNLTLLTGFNAGGKSTTIQPLLLLAQALRNEGLPTELPLNGPLVRLGAVADVLPIATDDPIVQIQVGNDIAEIAWALKAQAGDRFLTVLDTFVVTSSREDLKEAERLNTTSIRAWAAGGLGGLIYISAVREGASDAFPMPDVQVHGVRDVGFDGRFGAYWYDQFVDSEVPESRRHPDQPASSFRKQLDAWAGALFPGAQANAQMIPQISMLSLQFRLSDIGSWQRPANVGYGLTYAFPILVALLMAKEDQVIVIDSPEAHLHPFAQSQMGRILAHFAAAGVQILAETHSDHLLNGVRLAVKEQKLSQEMLQIHFFSGPGAPAHGVVSLSVDHEGRIDEWPAGFFDQSEKDLSRLAGWTC